MRLVDRDVAPAEDDLALGADVALDELLDLLAVRRVVGQEAHADPVAPRLGQLELGDAPEEGVGKLGEDPRAVARAHVGALRAAVLQVVEGLERANHDLVARLVVEARDHRDAAGVVFEPRVVETVGVWRLGVGHV